jgi:pimeloyl-ACP methyl ester carboxylesterase
MKLEIISKHPKGEAKATPLLFVHGASLAAWCWDVHFLDFFASHGYSAHAVSLRGHGKSEGREKLKWFRVSEYVQDVENAVGQLPSPPVLIGHSMGGLVVQKYLEKHQPPAAVLMASVPVAGILASTLRAAWRHPFIFTKANLKMSFQTMIGTPALANETHYSEGLTEEVMLSYFNQIQEESFMAFQDMLALCLPKPAKLKTPLLVLGAKLDYLFKPNEIQATAKAYGVQAEIFENMAHNMMLEARWQIVAERILGWLKERELP